MYFKFVHIDFEYAGCEIIPKQCNEIDCDTIVNDCEIIKDKVFNSVFRCNNGDIHIIVDGNCFCFSVVPGDGDCFYHSILKSDYLSIFTGVYQLRMHLASIVEMNHRNDTILQKLFYFHRTDPLIWLPRIRKMNTWANQLDIIIAAYVLHINIITVGNYMHGFICNNMQLYMNNVLRSSDYCITEGGTLYVYFHEFQHPMRRMTDGNHFVYMEPILYIADTNLANQQDEQLCAVTNVWNISQCNTNHGITNLDAINN